MTNFLKMAHEISDLGFDVYVFKGRCKMLFFVHRQTGRIYVCFYDAPVIPYEDGIYGFGAIEKDSKTNQPRYSGAAYGCFLLPDGSLNPPNLKAFVAKIFSDMEESYEQKKLGYYDFYTTDVFTERDIARLGYMLGFRYKYKIEPTYSI